MNYICPICGYPELNTPPYDAYGDPTYIICDCCGFEFGFDNGQSTSFEDYRETWIINGAKWFNKDKRPLHWDLNEQLQNIE